MDPKYFKDRNEWRSWLEKHFEVDKEVWLLYYKKHTGKPGVSYEEAVEEAICFGWIDGKVKTIDSEKYMQRYTPRNQKSLWSENNIERAQRMIHEGKMKKQGQEIFHNAMKNNQTVPTVKNFSISKDLMNALLKDSIAYNNFTAFAASDQLMYSYWVDSAKRDATRKKRIMEVVRRSLQNKKPGDP